LNKEGADLDEPLPANWKLENLQTLPVVLYDNIISPPCCKIRFLLHWYGIPFSSVKGPRRTGEYKKIPALDIATRQINDSFVMVKSLARILQGTPLTAAEEDLEKQMTFGLMVALEKNTAGNSRDLRGCGCLHGGCPGCFLYTFSCCLACCAAGRVGKDAPQILGEEPRSIDEYAAMLRNHLGSSKFLGGDEPKVLDVSVFGVLTPFEKAQCACVPCLLGSSDDPLRKWYSRMQEQAQQKQISMF